VKTLDSENQGLEHGHISARFQANDTKRTLYIYTVFGHLEFPTFLEMVKINQDSKNPIEMVRLARNSPFFAGILSLIQHLLFLFNVKTRTLAG